ncbi:hypothetical protein PGTUg99_036860 [Puccinia graminis f. sp. tritici]|uniref:Uncharacterized protein n=1 Tax=Puccinia graminis f. sp. tritici TaxID=56615 RepID=A0A5B0SPS4_PUCGR|nr:hypothetical protein PGTUg99_036860 [Puccinia graminis f. sp. tritici]
MLERLLKIILSSIHPIVTFGSMMNMMKAFIVVIFDYFLFQILAIIVGSTSTDSPLKFVEELPSNSLTRRSTNNLAKRTVPTVLDACESSQAAPRAVLHAGAPVAVTTRPPDVPELVESATPGGRSVGDEQIDEVSDEEVVIANDLPFPTQVSTIYETKTSLDPNLQLQAKKQLERLDSESQNSESQNGSLDSRGYFKALQDYVEQVKAKDSRPRRSSSAAQGIVPPGRVQTYRKRYEKLIKQREAPLVKTETPFSFVELLSRGKSMLTFHAKKFLGRMMNKMQSFQFKNLRNILHPMKSPAPTPALKEIELSNLGCNYLSGLKYVLTFLQFQSIFLRPNHYNSFEIGYKTDVSRLNPTGLQLLTANGPKWRDAGVHQAMPHPLRNLDLEQSIRPVDIPDWLKEKKEVIPHEYYSANLLPLNHRLESLETAPDLTENGEVVHPLMTDSTGAIPSDELSKPPVPHAPLAEEDISIGNLSNNEKEKSVDPEENEMEAGTGLGVAEEVPLTKETGNPVNELEGGKSQPFSHVDKEAPEEEQNSAKKSRKQEENAGSENTQDGITVPDEVPGEMETKIPLDMVLTEQLHKDPVAERAEEYSPAGESPRQEEKQDASPLGSEPEAHHGPEFVHAKPEEEETDTAFNEAETKQPEPSSGDKDEENLSHQIPPVDKGIMGVAHHPLGELGESFAEKDGKPSTSQAEGNSSQNQGEVQENVQAHSVQSEKSDSSPNAKKTSSDSHQEPESETPPSIQESYAKPTDKKSDSDPTPEDIALAAKKETGTSSPIEGPEPSQHEQSALEPLVAGVERYPVRNFHYDSKPETDQQDSAPVASARKGFHPVLNELMGSKNGPSQSAESHEIGGQSEKNQDFTPRPEASSLGTQTTEPLNTVPEAHEAPTYGNDDSSTTKPIPNEAEEMRDPLISGVEANANGNGHSVSNLQQGSKMHNSNHLTDGSNAPPVNGKTASYKDPLKLSKTMDITSRSLESFEIPAQSHKTHDVTQPLQAPQTNNLVNSAPHAHAEPISHRGEEDPLSTRPVKEVEPAPVKPRFAFLPEPIQVPQLSLRYKPEAHFLGHARSMQGQRANNGRFNRGFSRLRPSESQQDLTKLTESTHTPFQSTNSQISRRKSVKLGDVTADSEEPKEPSLNREYPGHIPPKGSQEDFRNNYDSTVADSDPSPQKDDMSSVKLPKDFFVTPQGLKPIITRKREIEPLETEEGKPIKDILAAFKQAQLEDSPRVGSPVDRLKGIMRSSPRGSPRRVGTPSPRRVGFVTTDSTQSRPKDKSKFYLEVVGAEEQNRGAEGSPVPPFQSSADDESPSKKPLARAKSAYYMKVSSPRVGGLDVFADKSKILRTYSVRTLEKDDPWDDKHEQDPATPRTKPKPLDLVFLQTVPEKIHNPEEDPAPRQRVPYYRRKADIIAGNKPRRPSKKGANPRRPRSRHPVNTKNLPAIKRGDKKLQQAKDFVRRLQRFTLNKAIPVVVKQPNLKANLVYPSLSLPVNSIDQSL